MPPSYYTDTNNDKEAFRRLEGSSKTDVCIIGGGFTGVAAALELAERGVKVSLLEQNLIGWGASGRNGGQLLGGYGPDMDDFAKYEKLYGKTNAQAVWDMGLECVDLVKDRIDKYRIECDLRSGYFDAAMNERELRALEETQKTLVAHGYRGEQKLVSGDASQKIVGSKRFIGGLVNNGWGHLNPLNLVRGEARAAENLGARIHEDARVETITYGDNGTIVDTGHGKVTAKKVIFAGGAYMGRLVPKLAGRIMSVGSYIIATEPLSETLVQEIMPADCAVCDQRWALDYFRMSPDRRLLFGGLARYSGSHPKNIETRMRVNMLKVFPQLAKTKIDFSWGGNIGVSLNRVPQIGMLKKGIYYAQAYSGHGVAASHMSARLLAEAITGDDARFNMLTGVKHRRFPGGRLFRRPLLAASMAFVQAAEAIKS
ncbi:MAG: FAD-binding oxidoreductase [Kordiimonadaceae bacterium]|nr:FAD-binding oxidoreductase [Kordiimonadaceae bacterium]